VNSFPPPPGGSGEAHQPGAIVLVVDDYRCLSTMIAGMLRSCGYHVLTASSGQEAKALARENAKIDLLLTDIEMPEMRGDELAAWFRTAKAETRILFMSSQPAFREELQPVHFLQKPFRVEVLFSKVREVLNRHSASSAKTTAS
jgi:CheY-like chemotaxis protein